MNEVIEQPVYWKEFTATIPDGVQVELCAWIDPEHANGCEVGDARVTANGITVIVKANDIIEHKVTAVLVAEKIREYEQQSTNVQ